MDLVQYGRIGKIKEDGLPLVINNGLILNFGRVNSSGTVFAFPISFTYFYHVVTGMQMTGWGVASHSVGILLEPKTNLSGNQFRMEENSTLSPGMNAEYLAIGY